LSRCPHYKPTLAIPANSPSVETSLSARASLLRTNEKETPLEYTRLGRTGLQVSRICLGCMSYGKSDAGTLRWQWTLPESESRPYVQRALEAGINFFDTANVYSLGESENVLGRAIRDFAKRDEVVIATKVWGPMFEKPNGKGLSRKAILSEIDHSLQRLGMDYVDLYQIHRFDYETPIEETLEALNDVVRAGKARYIGASSMHAWQFMKMLAVQKQNGWAQFVSMQNYYNLIYREEEREMMPLCLSEGVGSIPWSPLARGRLARPWTDEPQTDRAKTDAFAKGLYEKTVAQDKPIVDRVNELARQRNISPSQIALAWVLSKPYVSSPIIGATKPQHLDDAVAAVSVKLSPDEIKSLEDLYQPHALSSAFQ
jgi:1-deoxyxylulose-5-phosphate synthase